MRPLTGEDMDPQYFPPQPRYDPNQLLNTFMMRLRLRNDAALSRKLEVDPAIISKVRHRRIPLGASVLIRMHEESGLSIRDLRTLMGDRRQHYRADDGTRKQAR
jgi:hypothetical protein